MNKICTTIEQSKKLLELRIDRILPLESADMSFVEKGDAKRTWYDAENRRITTAYEKKYYIPCWSLTALLSVLPTFSIDSSDDHYFRIYCQKKFSEWHDNPIDACYEMICWLKENSKI